jgi:hypothetical protein
LKKVLIISPHFPPINAADMHRVRHLVNYTEEFGWHAEIVTVNPRFIESYSNDELLLQSIPKSLKIHYCGAWNVKYTRKIGLGSLSIRSFFFFKTKVNKLLRSRNFDLIFFSTTAFHVMALGPYWKAKFGIPFVLDIQDPWRSDFYLNRPKNERPPKFWISYFIDKFLEKITVPRADAIISVSEAYVNTFHQRYINLKARCEIIPFSGFDKDFHLIHNVELPQDVVFSKDKLNVVYVGRGGHDMKKAVTIYFKALKIIKESKPEIFSRIKTYFFGTSYAPNGLGTKTLVPVAVEIDKDNNVVEITNRFQYFVSLKLLKSADILFIPGSLDSGYTASKVFPYILSEKPIVACFHEKSSVVEILRQSTRAEICTFNSETVESDTIINEMVSCILKSIGNVGIEQPYNKEAFERYSARSMTRDIAILFNHVIAN